MSSLIKEDFPPLLSMGMHSMSVAELRTLSVDGFQLSSTRENIMREVEKFIEKLADADIPGELWIDGSFLTQKIDPEDADIVVRLDSKTVETATKYQNDVLSWVSNGPSELPLCHAYIHIEYPDGNPLYWQGQWMRAYWIRQWGFDRKSTVKGFAVLSLSGV